VGIFPTCTTNIASNPLKKHSRSHGALFANEQTFFIQGVLASAREEKGSMAGKGHCMALEDVQRIIYLLDSTEMTVAEIAERMSCSRSVVVTINRRFQVREYSGLRTRWLKVQRKAAA
jgi:hypothetical protein